MPLGLYIAVPFCRTKCSYCNFASDVFSKSAYENYVARVIEEIAASRATAAEVGGQFDEQADSVYLGGGTPSILENSQLLRIFEAAREQFDVSPEAEITVECAPGTLTDVLIETLLRAGVNRISLGVQSFVDREAQSVARLHKRATVLDEVARLRHSGLDNINVDLIAGLPYQTTQSWSFSLDEVLALGVPHVSVYMLEIDEDSRLGSELMAGGTRYHAHFVPDDAATADFYNQACETLAAGGIEQYEISNFARSRSEAARDGSSLPGAGSWESRHNLKYWKRQPYLGFGVDAHSMLRFRADADGARAVRISTPESLDDYMKQSPRKVVPVDKRAAMEESFFLGLRLNGGVEIEALREEFGSDLASYGPAIDDCIRDGLIVQQGGNIRLTPRGRLLSNEAFSRFLLGEIEQNSCS
ncbi:MAG TPA: radical SAM family heme chaperone HemW [Terriglobales bacterium]|nr:radical SAM family heme chaperone HemW [Terriglobales bacterium]